MNFPHHYQVTATATSEGDVALSCEGLTTLASNAPAQFGGPGDKWSPEDLLTAAVADCFVLSFRAIAAASRLPFTNLTVQVTGTLDRVERVMLFTGFDIKAELQVAADVDAEKAKRLLEKAEQSCLVTNSLKSEVHLTAVVNAS